MIVLLLTYQARFDYYHLNYNEISLMCQQLRLGEKHLLWSELQCSFPSIIFSRLRFRCNFSVSTMLSQTFGIEKREAEIMLLYPFYLLANLRVRKLLNSLHLNSLYSIYIIVKAAGKKHLMSKHKWSCAICQEARLIPCSTQIGTLSRSSYRYLGITT